MNHDHTPTSRRSALLTMGQTALLLAATDSALAASTASSDTGPIILQDGRPSAGSLAELAKRLAGAPRRRNFQTVPFILTSADMWDHEAAAEVLSYGYRSLQVWECTELTAPWLNLMREAINGQVFSHGNPEFLAVAANHGTAHLALFNQAVWDTYKLAQLAGGTVQANDFISERPGVSPKDDVQNVAGFYGPFNNNIVSLQRRGAVFIACHDSIHAIARNLHGRAEHSQTPADVIAADLTNNLVPGVVLVPSVVAFLVELQRAGFTYSKGN